LNSIQFNGKYGCAKCYQPGVTVSTSTRGHTHAYPFNAVDPVGPKQTTSAHVLDARKAHLENSAIKGIKGPTYTWLMKLSSYDIITGTVIDYMHCTLLGVMKQLMSLWFGTEHNKEKYYISRHISVVDQRLKEIKLPSIISRKPRAISEHFKYFKASELRSFLLYYSLPVLFGILPPEYWDHFALFSISIHILVQPSISEYQVQCCQKMLNRFCKYYKDMYSERYMSANVHLLLHLLDTVRELGPLWVYSCFHFEGLNEILKNLVHGTQQVNKQLITSYSYVKQLPVVANEYTQSSPYLEAFKHIYSRHRQCLSNYTIISNNICLLGKPDHILTEEDKLVLSSCGYQDYTRVDKYLRIIFKDINYYSCNWNKSNCNRNNATVAYYIHEKDELHFGIIQSFLLCNSSPPVVFCVLAKLIRCNQPFTMFNSSNHIPHIISCLPPTQDHEIVAIPIEHIYSQCIYLSFNDIKDTVFVVIPANLLEKD